MRVNLIKKMTKNQTSLPTLDSNSVKTENSALNFQNSHTSSSSISVAKAIAFMLESMDIKYAFGVSGGAMATLWSALSNSSIEIIHCRHEGGAAFAATEASLISDHPTVVFTTAGPGITNALTGLFAARGEGAKVIFLSACTSAPQRGRWAIQETSEFTLPQSGLFTPGMLFDYATKVESPQQIPQIFRSLALGLSSSRGFVAHISIPTAIQTSSLSSSSLPNLNLNLAPSICSKKTITQSVEMLKEPFAIWLGFGARGAANEILQLAEKTGAAVMCSPRGKGIFPEDHPQFIGVTGLGGHASVMTYMREQPPLRTLVLGTRLSEPTSFWNEEMIPQKGFIHVDIDPSVPGVAYPSAPTFPICSDIKTFLTQILENTAEKSNKKAINLLKLHLSIDCFGKSELVRPEVLMAAIQEQIVERSDAVILAESGNSFTWATHCLRIDRPNRYRVSTGVGAMGHTVAGVIGAALVNNGKAVAIVGDGSMLMNNEISTAVKYQIPAVWIVLNDARYNMCHQGMATLGIKGADALLPKTDFVAISKGMGAEGIRVTQESELSSALEQAMSATVPFVVDVIINPERLAPSGGRNKSLRAQGVKSSSQSPEEQISFPKV
jgi:thiamine pyrophosphate-dependent acetolactate synthase large subunit-like protein